MKAQIVEIDTRVRVTGFWLLPGARLEFNTLGQANTFINRNGGTNVNSKPERKPKKPADDKKADRPATTSGDSGASKEHAKAVTE